MYSHKMNNWGRLGSDAIMLYDARTGELAEWSNAAHC